MLVATASIRGLLSSEMLENDRGVDGAPAEDHRHVRGDARGDVSFRLEIAERYGKFRRIRNEVTNHVLLITVWLAGFGMAGRYPRVLF